MYLSKGLKVSAFWTNLYEISSSFSLFSFSLPIICKVHSAFQNYKISTFRNELSVTVLNSVKCIMWGLVFFLLFITLSFREMKHKNEWMLKNLVWILGEIKFKWIRVKQATLNNLNILHLKLGRHHFQFSFSRP